MTNQFIVKRYLVFNKKEKVVRNICSVRCPGCNHDHRLSSFGWTAIVCQSCGAELYLENHAPKGLKNG